MKRDIVTITLNPSIDVTLWVDGLDDDKVNRVQKERREAGGKGVNVARVTGDFGIHTCCIVVAGKDNADELHRYLDDEDLLCDMLRVDGAVRENLTLRCGGADETTLREPLWRSEGTTDQLYLALRLAVAQERTPDAPLILDDAFVRFDDTRLQAALGLLKEIAEEKQVILFTCQSREQEILR